MFGVTKICKICGKEYQYCSTKASAFRYHDVACCPEHAVEYFKKVETARANLNNEAPRGCLKNDDNCSDSNLDISLHNEDFCAYEIDEELDDDIEEDEDYSYSEDYEE